MANKPSIEKIKMVIGLDLELAGRLRTWLKGRTKSAISRNGLKIRKPVVAMGPSDFFDDLAEKALADVQMDAESRKWVEAQLAKNIEVRKKLIAYEIKKRKDANWSGYGYSSPKYAKRGVKKGNKSPKWLASMKALGEKRRKEGWKRGPSKNKPASPAPSVPKRGRGRPRKNPAA